MLPPLSPVWRERDLLLPGHAKVLTFELGLVRAVEGR